MSYVIVEIERIKKKQINKIGWHEIGWDGIEWNEIGYDGMR